MRGKYVVFSVETIDEMQILEMGASKKDNGTICRNELQGIIPAQISELNSVTQI